MGVEAVSSICPLIETLSYFIQYNDDTGYSLPAELHTDLSRRLARSQGVSHCSGETRTLLLHVIAE
jgi:hypothetical protein